jgi:hypothetical protein
MFAWGLSSGVISQNQEKPKKSSNSSKWRYQMEKITCPNSNDIVKVFTSPAP